MQTAYKAAGCAGRPEKSRRFSGERAVEILTFMEKPYKIYENSQALRRFCLSAKNRKVYSKTARFPAGRRAVFQNSEKVGIR